MKNYLSLTFLLCLFFANAQKSNELDKLPVEASVDEVTIREVAYMAIFPGCEKIDVNDKKVLQSCLAKELNVLLSKKLDSFTDKLDKKGLISAVAKIQFVIDKSGNIIQIKAMEGGQKDLSKEAELAMNEIAKKIKKIQPATLEDGMPVNLVFQLPVKFVIQDSKINEFQWSEIVVYTMMNENEKFEIRENIKESNFKVYDVQKDKNLFLGNFKSFDQILALDPYKTIYSSNNRGLIAEKMIDKELYRLYYSSEHKDFMDAYKVVDGVEELIESFPKESLQFSSLYLKLVLRK